MLLPKPAVSPMGKVVYFPDNGAPKTEEEYALHCDDTNEQDIDRVLRHWASNGQINRVKKFHELTVELLAARGELEIAE